MHVGQNDTKEVFTKSLKASGVLASIYSGGAIYFDSTGNRLYCLYKGSIRIVNPISGRRVGQIGVSDDDKDEDQEDDLLSGFITTRKFTANEIINFIVLKSGNQIVVFERNGVTKLVSLQYVDMKGYEELLPHEQIRTQLGDLLSTTATATWRIGFTSNNAGVLCCAAVDPTDSYLAVGFTNATILVYALQQGNGNILCTHIFKQKKSIRTSVSCLDFHPRRLLLFGGYSDGTIRVFDLFRHSCLVSLKTHSAKVTSITQLILKKASAIGGFISASHDKTVCIWDLSKIEELTNQVFQKAYLASASKKRRAPESSFEIGSPVSPGEEDIFARRKRRRKVDEEGSHVSESSASSVWCTDYLKNIAATEDTSPEDAVLVKESILPIKQIITGEETESLVTVESKYLDLPESCKISCPWVIVTGGFEGCLKVWDPTTGTCLWNNSENTANNVLLPQKQRIVSLVKVQRVVSSSSGADKQVASCLLSVGEFQSIIIWNMSLNIVSSILGNNGDICDCILSDRSLCQSRQLSNCNSATTVILDGSEAPRRCELSVGHSAADSDMVLKRKSLLRTGTLSSSNMWYRGHTHNVTCGSISVEGCWFASGSRDSTIRIWNVRTCLCVGIIRSHLGPVNAVCFNKLKPRNLLCSCEVPPKDQPYAADINGRGLFLASCGSSDKCIKLWGLDRNRLAAQLALGSCSDSQEVVELASKVAHAKEVTCLDISRDDQVLISGSADKTVKVWKIPTLEAIATCKGHSRAITCVAFSPVEKLFVSGSADAEVKVWNLKDCSCMRTLQGSSAIRCVTFHPNSIQLFTGDAEGALKLWHLQTGDCVVSIPSHTDGVTAVCVIPPQNNDSHGELAVISCGGDQSAVIWKDWTPHQDAEDSAQREREEKQRTEIDLLLKNQDYGNAFKLLLQYNRPKQFREAIESCARNSLTRHLTSSNVCSKDEHAALQITPGGGDPTKDFECHVSELLKLLTQNPKKRTDAGGASMSSDVLLERFLQFCLIWNMNSKTAWIANWGVSLVLKNIGSERLTTSLSGFTNFVKGFCCYNDKHLRRVGQMTEKSYLMDLLLAAQT